MSGDAAVALEPADGALDGMAWPDSVAKELRTSFISMMSYQGVPVEEIARLGAGLLRTN